MRSPLLCKLGWHLWERGFDAKPLPKLGAGVRQMTQWRHVRVCRCCGHKQFQLLDRNHVGPWTDEKTKG